MTSFIDSGYATRKEWEAAMASGAGGAPMDCPTLGYWKIRGLAAAPRMMFYYKGQKFINKAFGEDAPKEWFGGDKAKLMEKNSMMNLPYIVDGDTVVTQSNSVLLYLGKKLGIDKEDLFFLNHQVLDQVMDLRNDTMKVVYPFGSVKTKEEFPAALEKHFKSASGHLTKLEGFCKGPFMCGPTPQSGDFHVWEMVDQHMIMSAEMAIPLDFSAFPKLVALHAALKSEPTLAAYFASDCYSKYAMNNPMPPTHFAGKAFTTFGPTVAEEIQP